MWRWKVNLVFVDWVSVTVFWEFSLRTIDGVAQLLSNEISKRLEAKQTYTQQVVRRVELFCMPQLEILIFSGLAIKKLSPL